MGQHIASLPLFLFALPVGALDIVDRCRLSIFAQFLFMMARPSSCV
jgi:hypothetical protein